MQYLGLSPKLGQCQWSMHGPSNCCCLRALGEHTALMERTAAVSAGPLGWEDTSKEQPAVFPLGGRRTFWDGGRQGGVELGRMVERGQFGAWEGGW